MSSIKVYSKLREVTPAGEKLRGEEGKRLGRYTVSFRLGAIVEYMLCIYVPLSSSPPHPFK